MKALGLVAGEGRLPVDIARAARRAGLCVSAVGFPELTAAELEAEVDHLHWLHLGEMKALLTVFEEAGIDRAVVAGKVPKTHLTTHADRLRPDALALELLAGLPDRSDDAILGAFARALTTYGIVLAPQAELVPDLLAPEGVFGATNPSAGQRADAAFGFRIAKALGGVDIGQSVVVQDGAVLAVEAIEGTDAAIARGGALGGLGVTVVKVAKPSQDPRFDLPAVGPATLDAMIGAGAKALAVEARATLVLDRDVMVARADEHGIALVGLTDGAPGTGGRG